MLISYITVSLSANLGEAPVQNIEQYDGEIFSATQNLTEFAMWHQ
jgi:hypothetical protein